MSEAALVNYEMIGRMAYDKVLHNKCVREL